MRFWISWYEPIDEAGDFRPRMWPLPTSIAAYWCSGGLLDGTAVTLCAVVDADDEDDARAAIRSAGWSPSEWRFARPQPDDWRPPSDRFPWPFGGSR